MNRGAVLPVAAATLALLPAPAAAHPDDQGPDFTAEERRTVLRLSPLDPERFRDPTNRWCGDERAERFGALLFFDTRLSADGKRSCATCHIPRKAWAGAGVPEPGMRRAPTLTNVGYNRWLNWDGSADSLWSQCLGPIESAQELNTSRVEIARRVQTEPDLSRAYRALFGSIPSEIAPSHLPLRGSPGPGDPTHPARRQWLSLSEPQRRAVNDVFVNVAKAIAAFEATIVSDDAPFDRFVAGLRSGDAEAPWALDAAARRGLKLFVGKARCVLCHSGPNLSDGEFHNVFAAADKMDKGRWDGIARLRASPFNFDSPHNDAEPGAAFPWLHFLRRTPENKGQFKTPTLRNVALTAPYMHNGRFATLEDVIDHYDTINAIRRPGNHAETVLTSLHLNAREKQDLIAFLNALTDNAMPPMPDLQQAAD